MCSSDLAVAVPTDSQGQQARIAVQQAEEVRTLESVTRQTPYDGGAFVELAAAYVRAGRPADATLAYRHALALNNVMLETRTGDAIWSHEVARRALANDQLLTAR